MPLRKQYGTRNDCFSSVFTQEEKRIQMGQNQGLNIERKGTEYKSDFPILVQENRDQENVMPQEKDLKRCLGKRRFQEGRGR